MKLTKKQEAELLQVYETWWYSYLNGDVKTYDSFLADDYHFVGSTNGEEYLNRKDTTAFFDATAHQIAGKAELRNLKRTIEELGEDLILITDVADAYVISETEWVFYSRFRFTSILKETSNGWRFIYQHFSAPDTKAQEGETLGTKQITKENQELKDAIKRRTVELEYKNRELEIEAATERVRVQSMAMQHPHDLEKVNKELLYQLTKLEIAGLTGVSFYFVDPNEIVTVWDLSSPGNLNDPNRYSFRFDSKKFPVLGGFVEILKSTQEDYFVLDFPKEKLLQGIEELKDIDLNIYNNYNHAFESGALQHQWNPAARITDGILSIDLIKPPADDTKTIVLKMSGAFNQAYQRFLDLQKAEAQAREAQIEAALEKVRSKAMAMHTSGELIEVAKELRKQVGLLGTKDLETCAINLYEEFEDKVLAMAGTRPATYEGEILELEFSFPKKGIVVIEEVLQAYNSGIEELIVQLDGAKLKEWLEVLQSALPDIHAVVLESTNVENISEFKTWWTIAYFPGGCLIMITMSPPDDPSRLLLKRFSQVFGLAYRRYADIKKAEAQTREAQIETSLERVRGKTMAMHKSEEVMDVAATLFEELQKLGFTFGASSIIIMDKDSGDAEYWIAGFRQQRFPESYLVKYFQHPYHDALFSSWKKGEKYLVYNLCGEDKKTYDDYLFTNTGYKNIPEQEQKMMREIETVTFSLSFMKHGALHWGPSPLNEEQANILQRFTTVFEQSFTRFQDLQKAEAQAREAQIEVALERVRARAMAMQNSDELAAAAQLLYQEFLKLGIKTFSCGYMFINEEKSTQTSWMVLPNGTLMPDPIIFPLTGDAVLNSRYEDWKLKKPLHVYLVQGEANKEHHRFLAQFVPSFVAEEIFNKVPDRLIFNCANFSEGYLLILTQESFTEEEQQTIIRFANVFDMTYTRFLDLQKAEAQAKEAKMHLVQIEAEKSRAETAFAELKEAQAQLIQSEKMASLGELTAGIAHEIQNPLNFVNNFSEVSNELLEELKEEIENKNFTDVKTIADDVMDNLTKILHHGKRADAIVKGMLQHSRNNSGQKEPTDINALTDEYLRLAYHGLRAKDTSFNATLKTDYDESIRNINIVPQDMGRVILNLITNAFYAVNERLLQAKASGNKNYEPTVMVTTKKVADTIHILIKDNGNGIPHKVLDKIFQPFFTTKPTGEGTGLGLSLSYDIVKVHGGELKVETQEGQGSKFLIQIPFV